MDNFHGFRRLLISNLAQQQKYGNLLVQNFETNQLEIVYLQDENEVFNHPYAHMNRTLIVLSSPQKGWISQAEHGHLSTRKNEYYLNPIIGCQFECNYCYLRAMPNIKNPVQIYVDTQSMFETLQERIAKTNEKLLFCTGELADSLAEIEVFPVTQMLVEFFSRQKNSQLEFRTKSDKVLSLLDLPHKGQTLVSFSIAPQLYIDKYEHGTAPLSNRIFAARQCYNSQYPIAFNLEPIIYGDNWEKYYEEMIGLISSEIGLQNIHHIHIGSLRWSENLAITPIFSQTYVKEIQSGVWIEYRPEKFNGTLNRDNRIEAYSWLASVLRKYGWEKPIFWSMEEPDVINLLSEK